MRRTFPFVALATLLILSAPGSHGQDFNRAPWLADFAQLKKELSEKYANLDWAVKERGLDLKQLSLETEAYLMQALNDNQAKKVFDWFLNAFGDGHLYIDWSQKKPEPVPSTASPQSDNSVPLCQRLSFNSVKQAPKINFSLLKAYEEISNADSKYFPIGTLQMSPGKKTGVIRISIFSEYAFPDLCELVTADLKLSADGSCDAACEEQIEIRAANLLTAALSRQIEVLKQHKIDRLLIDITGNGGGTNWIEPAARTLSAKQLKSPRQLFIRHDHWVSQLKRRLETIRLAVQRPEASNKQDLQNAERILASALSASQQPCDRSMIWENKQPSCSLVSDISLYPQSVLPYAKAGTPTNLFYPGRYTYREGVYSGPLIVMVDGNTWSSAEYFAAMLKDNNAAIIIGEPTGGAGCGYTNGGIPTYLKNCGAKVKIPDCIRLRADGSNEVAGIIPDILIPWRRNDSPYQKAKRVFDTLMSTQQR